MPLLNKLSVGLYLLEESLEYENEDEPGVGGSKKLGNVAVLKPDPPSG